MQVPRRHGLDPWVRKIAWRRKWQPFSKFAWRIPWTEDPGGYSLWGPKESDTTEHACMHAGDLYVTVFLENILMPFINT